MKKAVLCFAHKNPDQINILIKQLLHATDGQTDVFIHFDKNHDNLCDGIIKNPNVFLIKNNVPVTWGDDSMVKAFVNSLNEIVSLGKTYDYFLACTGQDLLVKQGLDSFLTQNLGKIYIDAYEKDKWERIFMLHSFPRGICKHIKKHSNPLRMIRGAYVTLIRTGIVPKRKINFDYSNWKFWYSFNWNAMPYECARYIVSFIKENPGVLDMYKNTFLPEDGFLATMIMNSPYAKNVVFTSDNIHTKTLTYFTGIVNQHCPVLAMDDITDIDKSECFFARKFDLDSSPDIVKYYEKLILDDKK